MIFATQPAIYRNDMSEKLRRLLWGGGVGDYQGTVGAAYYSVEALEWALTLYNDATLAVCQVTSAECIDLATQLTADTSTFYDDVHFNEQGARSVARIFGERLARPAFRP